jgi:hypothetical protein
LVEPNYQYILLDDNNSNINNNTYANDNANLTIKIKPICNDVNCAPIKKIYLKKENYKNNTELDEQTIDNI